MHNSVAISKYITYSTYSLNGSVNRKFANVSSVSNISPFMYMNTLQESHWLMLKNGVTLPDTHVEVVEVNANTVTINPRRLTCSS